MTAAIHVYLVYNKKLKNMNWNTLRPLLRQEFGKNFMFYNDLYKSGTRRIKIRSNSTEEIYNFIKNISPELNVNIYQEEVWTNLFTSVTIHYR